MFEHKTFVRSAGVRYDGNRLWQWHCPLWNHGWNRDCRGNTYGSWATCVKYAIRHAITDGRSYS